MIIRPIIKEFSANIVEGIDESKYADILLIDKIGIRIPTDILNLEKCKEFRKDTPITILIQNQSIAEVCIHDQWQPMVPNHLYRVMLASQFLLNMGVLKSLPNCLELIELEIAFDIYGIIPEIEFRLPSFKRYRNTETYYLHDYHRLTRENEYGKKWSKGVQKSFIKYYNKAAQLNSYYPQYRFEFRFQGKYKSELALNFLNGDTYTILNNYYVFIIYNSRNLINYGDIAVSESTASQITPVFRQLLLAIGAKLFENNAQWGSINI